MWRFLVPVLGLLCALPFTTLAADPAAGRKLIAHEWGTFTTLVGSDGRQLPFWAGVGSDLPSFVLTRDEQAARFNPGQSQLSWEIFSKDQITALVRMETPVVYFYTDVPREVEARVEFPQGMLTEFYPPVRSMTPAYDPKDGREVLRGTSLDWGKFRIVPASVSAKYPQEEVPNPLVGIRNHYFHARETDAATVQFSDRPGETHEENFLFYRGLGNFNLRVTVTASGKDQFTFHNNSGGPMSTAFLIRSAGGGRMRFATYRNPSNGQSQSMRLPSEETSVHELSEAIAQALVAEGLYCKEARAMVKTWEKSWFGEEGTGTRVLYLLSRKATDELLPLQINPTPDETVRVMVGRIDVLTPEQESRIATMFRKTAANEALTAAEAREVRALGRFQQPALDRVATMRVRDLMQALRTAEGAQNRVNGG